MRLLERTLRWVALAPRVVRQDDLGGVTEGFSEQVTRVRASVIPSGSNVLRQAEPGLWQSSTMCLLLPLDAPIAPGDGITLDGDASRWRCVDVQKWSAHQAVQAVRITG